MLILHIWGAANPLPERPDSLYIALHQRRSSPPPQKSNEMTQTIKFISSKLNSWRRYRNSLRELYSLNDRELADLGIARWEIDEIARRSAGL